MAPTLILVDERTGTSYDLSAWGTLPDLSEEVEANGRPSSLDIRVWSYQPNAGTLPVVPVAGQVVVLGDAAFAPGNPDPWQYWFVGKLVTPAVPTVGADRIEYTLECEDFTRELHTPVTGLTFNGTTHPNDTSRVQALFAAVDLPGVWDVSTYVTGPFATWASTDVTPVRGKTGDILTQIAEYAGVAENVAPRRIIVGGYWTNPADYDAGITRYLSYYAPTGLPIAYPPLTDSADGQADYVADAFGRGNSLTSVGLADTGQAWSALAGTWGLNNGRAYNPTGAANNVAIVESTIADAVVTATLHVTATDVGIAARVSADGGNVWKGWVLLAQAASSRYGVYQRNAGNYGLIGTIAVTPAADDVLRFTLSGSSVRADIYRSGVSVGNYSTTDSFNSTATWHGLIAVANQFAARWDDFSVRGQGQWYQALHATPDGGQLANVLMVEGPGLDPTPVAWDTVTQPAANASTVAGFVRKTAATNAYDAGATVLQTLGPEGGELIWATDNRQIGADTFQRPDDEFLGALETGQDWQRYNGAFGWGILSNTAYCHTVGASGRGVAVVNAGASSCIVECKLSTLVTNASRVCVRVSNQDNMLLVLPAAGTYELYKCVAGALTLLGSGGGTPANGDVVKISLEDAVIQVYINGILRIGPITETFNQSVMFHGFGTTSAGGAARWDNFSIRQTYAERVVGWRTGASSGSRQTPDFGVKFTAGRQAQVTEGGVLKGSARTYAPGEAWRIAVSLHLKESAPYTEYRVEYSYKAVNATVWTLWYTSASHPDLVLNSYHADIALYHAGSSVSQITVELYKANLFVDAASIVTFGVWPAGDVVQDTSLDTYQKRKDHALTYFAEKAGYNKSYTVRVPRRYTGGTQVLFNATRLGITNSLKAVVQSKVDRSSGNRTTWWYELTLDAPPRLYGIRDRNRFLGRGPDGVTTPTQPQGLAAGTPYPDGAGQHSIVPVSWAAPPANVQWIDLWAQRVGTGGDVRLSLPAGQREGQVEVEFLAVYHLSARFVPFVGQPGPWCASIDIQGSAPPAPRPDQPTGLFVSSKGIDGSTGKGWARIGMTLSDDPQDHVWLHIVGGGHTYDQERLIPRGSARIFTADGLTVGVSYAVSAAAMYHGYIGDYNTAPPASESPLTFTIGGAGDGPIGGGGFPQPDAPLWPFFKTSGTADPTIDSSDPFAGGAAYKVTSAGADTVKLTSIEQPTYAGQVSVVRTAAKKSGGSPTLGEAMQFDDGSGAWALTGVTLTLPALTTSWPTNYTEQQVISPANAKFKRLTATFTFVAAATILAALPMPEPVKGTMDLKLNTDPLAPLPINDVNGIRRGELSAANATPSNVVLTGVVTGGVQVGLTLDSTYGDVVQVGVGLASGGISLTSATNKDIAINPVGTGHLELQGIRETRGGSFPASPVTDDRHYRTDLHLWAYWDGARWLSEQEIEVGAWTYYVGATAANELTASQEYMNTEMRSDYAYRITRFRIQGYVNGTNNGSNYWDVTLRSFTGLTTLANLSTSGWAGGTWTAGNTTTFSAHPTLGEGLQLYVNKTGAPGPLRFYFKVYARLVIT